MAVKRKAKRRAIYVIIAIVVIAAFFVARPMLKPKEKPIIRTAKAEIGTVTSSVSANGVLEPLTTVEVKSNIGGQVIELAVDEGDEVEPGQLIARIDPTDTLTAYEQSQAELESAISRVDQAREQLTMQNTQTDAQIESAKQGLEAARARLAQAQEQARVQPTLTSASISQAKSSLASAEASLRQARDAIIPQKLTSAQSSFDQAKASRDTAQKELERQRELLSRGFVPKSQVEAAEEKYSVAQAQLETARRKLDTVKDETDQDLNTARARVEQAKAEVESANANSIQVKIRQQELASAQAAVKQAEAALKTAQAATHQDKIRRGDIVQASAQVQRSEASLRNTRTELGYTTIVAPRAGVVTKKYVEEGSIVTAGRSSFSGSGAGVGIVDIADVTRMFVLVHVDETDIAHIEVGQEVDVTIEAYPDELFEGKVTKIAPQSVTEQNVTTIPVTVEIYLPDQRLKPGMNANCDFITGRARDVVVVPTEAVNEDDSGYIVTVTEGEKQTIRKVEIGLVGPDNTEIKKGLKSGETVVTTTINPMNSGRSSNGRPGNPGSPGGMATPPRGMRRAM